MAWFKTRAEDFSISRGQYEQASERVCIGLSGVKMSCSVRTMQQKANDHERSDMSQSGLECRQSKIARGSRGTQKTRAECNRIILPLQFPSAASLDVLPTYLNMISLACTSFHAQVIYIVTDARSMAAAMTCTCCKLRQTCRRKLSIHERLAPCLLMRDTCICQCSTHLHNATMDRSLNIRFDESTFRNLQPCAELVSRHIFPCETSNHSGPRMDAQQTGLSCSRKIVYRLVWSDFFFSP